MAVAVIVDEVDSGVDEEVVGVVSRALVLLILFWVSHVTAELCSGRGVSCLLKLARIALRTM